MGSLECSVSKKAAHSHSEKAKLWQPKRLELLGVEAEDTQMLQ